MADIRQAIQFHPFGQRRLGEILGLDIPALARTQNPLRQLQYIEGYLTDLKCGSVVVEGHYVDRDHIEDHGAFYARNFVSYDNFCKRLHFFSLELGALRKELDGLVDLGKTNKEEYRLSCKAFSVSHYLGFAVIKPLSGCPVGRTILRAYAPEGDKCTRVFPCVRWHRAHLLGVELSVKGLPFQQQDTGVSACATTAIWAALHHLRGVEDVAAATPAQVTNVASKYSLPFGRPMPSEGLSVEQMCQAIQGLGVSPHLHRAHDFSTAQGIIYSATMSEMACILITQREGKSGTERHAVAVAGLKIADSFSPVASLGVAEDATAMLGAYVHDDRWGPYVSTLFENKGTNGSLRYLCRGVIKDEENWFVTHVLIPMHAKIRLSFSGLQEVGVEICKLIQWYYLTHLKPTEAPDVRVNTLMLRGYRYVEELLFEDSGFSAASVHAFTAEVSLPRYVGRVRVENPTFGILDILVDTTGTLRNLHCSAVLCRGRSAQHTVFIAEFLATQLRTFQRAFCLPSATG
jgi:hypothetical protein